MAEKYGLIPFQSLLPRLAWQFIFFPLEYLVHVPPMFCAPFAGSILLACAGVLKIYLDALRYVIMRSSMAWQVFVIFLFFNAERWR